MQIDVIRPQYQFLQLSQRFRAFVSGYGTGKTWVGCMALCANSWADPGKNQGYFAPTYPQIRDIFWPSIDEVAFNMGLRADIKESNKEVHLFSNNQYRSTVICRSMERPGMIIGFKIAHAHVDEIDVLPMDKATTAWRKILARMRYPEAKNGVDVTTTPEGFRFVHKLFVSQLTENPDMRNRYAMIQASTYENAKNLPADYIPSLVEAYPKELIDAYINGQFCNLKSGTVFYKYDRVANRSKETIRTEKDRFGNIKADALYIGMDFNVGKMMARIFVIRQNGWHCVSEINNVFDTPEMIRIIKDRFKEHSITVYPDATGDSRKSVDASKSDITLLQMAGFLVRTRKVNPAVKDRILATNKQFEVNNLWVNDKECPTTASHLEQLSYDENGEPDKKSGFDHSCDGFSYPISYEFPIVHPRIDRVTAVPRLVSSGFRGY